MFGITVKPKDEFKVTQQELEQCYQLAEQIKPSELTQYDFEEILADNGLNDE